MGKKQTLSVCLIVRNEEVMLPQALKSVAGVADEVVVVDTGSSDATVSIAHHWGARVYEKTWEDDFSRARNQAIDKARCDWILFLDADETLRSGQRKTLRGLLQSPADAWFVQVRSPLTESQSGQVFAHYFERLFRRHPEVRYRGRVHEQIGPALQHVGARVSKSNLILDHTGYAVDRQRTETKLRRNLHLLKLDQIDREHTGYVQFHLGETYSMLHESQLALTHYRQALSCEDLPTAYRSTTHQNLASQAQKMGEWEQAINHATHALDIEPEAQSARLVRSLALLKSGQVSDAIVDLNDYLRWADRRGSSTLSFGMEPDPVRALRIRGECHLHAGNLKLARADAQRIIVEQPNWDGGHRLQGRINLLEGRLEEAMTDYQRVLDSHPEDQEALRRLAGLHQKLGRLDEARVYLARLRGKMETTTVLIRDSGIPESNCLG